MEGIERISQREPRGKYVQTRDKQVYDSAIAKCETEKMHENYRKTRRHIKREYLTFKYVGHSTNY